MPCPIWAPRTRQRCRTFSWKWLMSKAGVCSSRRRPNALAAHSASFAGQRTPWDGWAHHTAVAPGHTAPLSAGQGTLEVGDEVIDVFDADRQAHDVVGHLEFGAAHRSVRHLGGVIHKRLDASE